MHIELTIRDKRKKWIDNPDYIVNRVLRNQWIEMPGGFGFGLPSLANLDYEGRGNSCFSHPSQLFFKFRIAVGFVYTNRWGISRDRSYPNFNEQCTSFVQEIGDYNCSFKTYNETQKW